MTNIDIFILARSNSQRLPKKHLLKINGITFIEMLVNRMKKAKKIRKIIVCTTNLASDDMFAKFLKDRKIECFRGDEKDILKRLLDAAMYYNTDTIIDISGDKIYTDVYYVEKVIEILEKNEIDFVRGSSTKGKFDPGDHFIHGMIPGGFKVTTLKQICKLKKSKDTENGYTEFFTSMDFVKKYYIVPKLDLRITKNIKLDLDYSEDLDLAKIIFNHVNENFHMEDILKLFSKNPDLVKITKSLLKEWRHNYNEQKKTIK